jgi:hypothetical protein
MTGARRSTALGLLWAFAGIGGAAAQVAGSTPTGAARTETEQVVTGWSARQSILGRAVYNAAGDKVGKALDLIVGTDLRVSFVVVAVGNRVGAAQHTVAVPAAQLRMQSGRIVLPDATRQSLAAQPAFVYAPITRTQSAIVERAPHDMDQARQALDVLERQAARSSGQDRERADREIALLRNTRQAVQDKLSRMDAASATQWQAAQAEVAQASAQLRGAMRRPGI